MKHTILILLLTLSCFAFSAPTIFDDSFQKKTEQSLTVPINVSFINGQLTVVNAPVNSNVEVFTMLGVSIFHNITLEQKQVFLIDLNKGYYIIKVAGITKKISVK